jgi:glucose/mannose-6-phosphate isomerase
MCSHIFFRTAILYIFLRKYRVRKYRKEELMLDDMNVLKQRDPQDALGVAGAQWEYYSHKFDTKFSPDQEVRNIVWAGMGGSAWPAGVLLSWPRVKLPLEISRDYEIPPYVNENTLFIASSYSGNTEETLAALAAAEKKDAQIVVIASGGKLMDIAKERDYPLFAIPTGIQPRMSTFYFVNIFIHIAADLDIMEASTSDVASTGEWLKGQMADWAKEVPTQNNLAKQLAIQLAGKTVIVYAGPKLFPAAHKWKICINENAKNTAWDNQYPEFSHNEFIGWSSHPIEKPFAVVEIRSNFEHERVKKRFEITERLLSGMRPTPIVVVPEGETLLQQLAWSLALGDFVGTYLAILNGVNPTPVELVEKLKAQLG